MVKLFKQVNYIKNWMFMLFAFFMPIDFHVATNILFVQIVLTLLSIRKDTFYLWIKNYYLFFILFILYLLSMMFHNENLKSIENKIPYIIFPFVFSSFKLQNIDYVLKYFVFGCLFAILICFIYPFIYYFNYDTFSFTPMYFEFKEIGIQQYDWVNYFISNHFTKVIMNRAYFSMFMSFAFFIVILKPYFKGLVKYLILLVLLMSIIQTYSVTGIIVFTIVGLGLIWSNLKTIMLKIFWILLLLISTFLLIRMDRINNFAKETNSLLSGKSIPKDAFGHRLIIWNTLKSYKAGDILFGCGVREAQHRINSVLNNELGWSFDWLENQKLYNAHNQYIQFLMEIGLAGLAIFLCIILKYVRDMAKLKIDLELIFIVLFCFQIFSESMLLRFWGMSFFMFFYCLFYQSKLNKFE